MPRPPRGRRHVTPASSGTLRGPAYAASRPLRALPRNRGHGGLGMLERSESGQRSGAEAAAGTEAAVERALKEPIAASPPAGVARGGVGAEPSTRALQVVFAGRSAIGLVREHNEDRLAWGESGGAALVTPAEEATFEEAAAGSDDALIFTVADGLGAYGGGDVAAGIAAEVSVGHAVAGATGGRIQALLRKAFELANQAVFDAVIAGSRGGGSGRKMQSTLTMLALSPGEATIAHVGDCRIYRLRGDAVEILTNDHSQVMELLRMRVISPEQALTHPARYALTRSIGGDITVRVDARTERLQAGDRFLLCSDGLWSNVSAAEIREALAQPPRIACDTLVDLALANGGDDNATAMTIHVASAGTRQETRTGWRRLFS